jgi:hypothetical protein
MQAGACLACGVFWVLYLFFALSRIRYILAAEGPVYLLLVALSLLNRVVPLFEYSLSAHKILDIAIGV